MKPRFPAGIESPRQLPDCAAEDCAEDFIEREPSTTQETAGMKATMPDVSSGLVRDWIAFAGKARCKYVQKTEDCQP
jgi:hypothetical protein